MGHNKGVLIPGVAFDAPDVGEVRSLVWQPFVFLEDVGLQLCGKQLVIFKIAVAVETDHVIVGDGLFQVFVAARIDFVGVCIVAHPAGEIFAVFFGMNTGLEFRFNLFEFELGIFFISAMAVEAGSFRLHAKVPGVREGAVIFGMAVGTLEFPVI
jgi:hypothetical protein